MLGVSKRLRSAFWSWIHLLEALVLEAKGLEDFHVSVSRVC